MAVPKQKTQELMERLNALIESGDVNAMAIARLKREAEAIAEVAGAEYWMIRGALAGLENDEEQVKKSFETALRLGRDSWRVWDNYAAALHNAGLYREAVNVAEKAYELHEREPLIVERIISSLQASGRIQDTRVWLDRLVRLKPERPYPSSDVLIEIGDFLTEHQVSDDTVEVCFSIADQIAKARQLSNPERVFRILEDEETQWVSIDMVVPVSPEDATDMNEEFANHISAIENFEIPLEFVNVMFMVE